MINVSQYGPMLLNVFVFSVWIYITYLAIVQTEIELKIAQWAIWLLATVGMLFLFKVFV